MGRLMAVKFIRLKEIGVHVVEQGVRVTMRYPSALVAPLSYSALNPGSRAGME